MQKIIYLSLLILLSGCHQPGIKIEVADEVPASEKIKGDWKSDYFENSRGAKIFAFSFQDSTCSFLYPGNLWDYTIVSDTLYIKRQSKERTTSALVYEVNIPFLIDSLTDDVLNLIPIEPDFKDYLWMFYSQNIEKIELTRIKKKRDYAIHRIGFYSTWCYGYCPVMYLEIDSVGNFYFHGKKFTDCEGLFRGQLSSEQCVTILNKINNTELDSLDKFYDASWTDSQTCGVRIETNNKTYESSAYSHNKEPVELRILLYELMELYKTIELTEDSTIQDEFRFQDFLEDEYAYQ